MTSPDPVPSDDVIREAAFGLQAIVRSRLPMRYYPGETFWSMFVGATLTRMCDTVDSLLALMSDDHHVDGQTLLRSLYEQVVTFAWISIEPESRQVRWGGTGLAERLKLRNDAEQFGETIMSGDETEDVRNRLGIGIEEDDRCGGTRKRKDPLPDRILPPTVQRALEADRYWSARIDGLHPSTHLLGFRGLYVGVYRLGSQAAHASMQALDPYVQADGNRRVVNHPRPGPRITWGLIPPLLGIAMIIAAEQVNWIDEAIVRDLVDRYRFANRLTPRVRPLEGAITPGWSLTGERVRGGHRA